MSDTLDRNLALRIGLAARALPGFAPADLIALLDAAVGLPLSEEKLDGLSMKAFRKAGGERFIAIPGVAQKDALAMLKGEAAADAALPDLDPFAEGDMPGSLRIACASNGGERLDGHFGSCGRFLIYQVSAEDCRLVDVRATAGSEEAEDKNVWRADLIADCQVLHVVSIGGPAVAKVVRRNIHPVKHPRALDARAVMADMQRVIAGSPPPWLARAMGREAETLKPFLSDAELADAEQ